MGEGNYGWWVTQKVEDHWRAEVKDWRFIDPKWETCLKHGRTIRFYVKKPK